MILTDAHCHLEAVRRQESVCGMCVSACALGDFAELASIENFDGLKRSYGLHPFQKVHEEDIETLADYLKNADAVGEAGFDKRTENGQKVGNSTVENIVGDLCTNRGFLTEWELFNVQLDLAVKNGLPLIVHCVGKFGILEKAIADFENPLMIHAAKCSIQEANALAKNDTYFSFGARELKTKKGMELAVKADINRILVESDADSSGLEKTFDIIAQARGMKTDFLAALVCENFNRFFSK